MIRDCIGPLSTTWQAKQTGGVTQRAIIWPDLSTTSPRIKRPLVTSSKLSQQRQQRHTLTETPGRGVHPKEAEGTRPRNLQGHPRDKIQLRRVVERLGQVHRKVANQNGHLNELII